MSKSSLLWIFNIILLVLISISCGQEYNSNYNDYDQYGGDIDTSTTFGAAFYVLKKRCFQCHQWGEYTTSQAWIDAGKVVPGNWDQTKELLQLKGYAASGGDMPKDPYSELTTEEAAKIELWVNGL
jgi:hypothetical protein